RWISIPLVDYDGTAPRVHCCGPFDESATMGTTSHTLRLISMLAALLVLGQAATSVRATGPDEATLPAGVKAVWDFEKAQRDKTVSRERVCLNGLWRWQPAKEGDAVPADNWGFFKVPGFWPGAASYIQEDNQTLYAHPSWKNADIRNLTAAWY